MKFFLKTFGCQMNVSDSRWLEKALQSRGWSPVENEEQADAILLNTCSVREKPEQKVYSQLGRLKSLYRKNPGTIIGVGGCVAQQVGTEFWNKFPLVRLVFGPDGIAFVPDSLEKLRFDPDLRISLLEFQEHYPEGEQVNSLHNSPLQAYVTIMEGCDNFCAYCIVPYTRGRQRSRSSSKILEECRILLQGGTKEITLLGQNVNSYGRDSCGDGVSFAELLERVCSLPGLERVRFTTSHPKDIAPEVIDSFERFPNLCPQLHLPLQAGSNSILKKMGRKYTREDYLDIVRRLREVRPDIVLGTDLMVGFPGETREDFEQTLDMLHRVGFDNSFSFKYSDRPGTRAAKMQGKVPEETKSARLRELQRLQEELTQDSLQSLLERETDVLLEGPSSWNDTELPSWQGREPGGRIVHCIDREGNFQSGQLVRVRIHSAKKNSLLAEVVKDGCSTDCCLCI